MPAISWPMTAGWPIRCINSPISRPQTSSAMIWTRKITSEGPREALSAANTDAETRQNGTAASNAGSGRRGSWSMLPGEIRGVRLCWQRALPSAFAVANLIATPINRVRSDEVSGDRRPATIDRRGARDRDLPLSHLYR